MLSPGQTMANFKVLKKLGEGGMGEVYLAEDQKLHRKVALKTLPADLFGDAERQKRFQREAQTAAQISHPHVMAIYDIGTATDPNSGQDLNYIIMEHVEGVPLMDYLQNRPNDIAAILRLSEKIASGLAAAHKMNIVHRDIKAANIAVNNEGEPKILDFGLAKPLDPLQWEAKDDSTESITQHLTKVGSIVGTVSYMSPEQARGEVVDTRSDVFSFGVLMYRMATGVFPFEGSTPVSTLAKILESKPERPRVKNPDVPEELERIIDKCLQKDPSDRYQDTRDLVVDLRNLRRQYDSGPTETVSAVRETPKEITESRRFKLSGKSLAVFVVAVVALAAIITGWLERGGRKSVPAVQAGENSLAILTFENKTGDSTYDWLETGLPEILLTDLVQTEAISLISRDRILDYLNRERKTGPDSYTHTDLTDAARALGAVNLLSGSLYKFGDHLRLDARLEQVASGKIILGEKVLGRDVFALVDSLTEKIAAKLDLTIPTASHVNVSELITPSTEAYRVYQEGMELFGLELYDEAVEKFSRALAIDPGFALAYMRIGMTRAFQGRPQEAARYLALAQENKGRLPHRERSLLEIYAGFWQEMKFDDAIVRLESFVNTYPDDKEARTVYAIVLAQLWSDTLRAFAHLDTALRTDPAFQLALSFYSYIYRDFGNLDKAIEYAERIRHFHPDSPESYTRLSDLYEKQMKYDDAIEELESMLTRFPDNADALFDLATLYIRKRDFARSRLCLEQVVEKHSDDPYRMIDYYGHLANLSNWSGQFKSVMDYYFKALEQAKLTGDSAIICGALDAVSTYYYRFDMPDSALYFSRESFRWANAFQRLGYPITLVSIDTSLIKEAQPIFDTALEDFKSRTPSTLWPIAAAEEKIFDAHCRLDTAALIDAYDELTKVQTERTSIANVREAGYLRVLSGQYEAGRQVLQRCVAGPDEVTSAYHYLYSSYLLGIANEGLGNTREAIKHYEEMLHYWNSPQIELKEIKDARARLAKLTS